MAAARYAHAGTANAAHASVSVRHIPSAVRLARGETPSLQIRAIAAPARIATAASSGRRPAGPSPGTTLPAIHATAPTCSQRTANALPASGYPARTDLAANNAAKGVQGNPRRPTSSPNVQCTPLVSGSASAAPHAVVCSSEIAHAVHAPNAARTGTTSALDRDAPDLPRTN